MYFNSKKSNGFAVKPVITKAKHQAFKIYNILMRLLRLGATLSRISL